MVRRNLDLLTIVVASLGLDLVIAVLHAPAVRIALGLPFVLFFPGYTFVAVFYPRKDDLPGVERLAFSLGLSLAIVPLLGLALNYTIWGIRLAPILVALTWFNILMADIAVYRRRSLEAAEAFTLPVGQLVPKWRATGTIDRLFAVLLALSVVGLGAAIYHAATSQASAEQFTEFYILGPNGKIGSYPSNIIVGERVSLIAGVVNHEGKAAGYRLAVQAGGQPEALMKSLTLADSQRWEGPVSFEVLQPGEATEVQFILYKRPSSEPYRTLHLIVNAEARPVLTP
jgi:uncharacterized membrane protein